MKRFPLFVLLAITSILFSACCNQQPNIEIFQVVATSSNGPIHNHQTVHG